MKKIIYCWATFFWIFGIFLFIIIIVSTIIIWGGIRLRSRLGILVCGRSKIRSILELVLQSKDRKNFFYRISDSIESFLLKTLTGNESSFSEASCGGVGSSDSELSEFELNMTVVVIFVVVWKVALSIAWNIVVVERVASALLQGLVHIISIT